MHLYSGSSWGFFEGLNDNFIKKNCILVGDFNICISDTSLISSPHSRTFNNSMLSKNFECLVKYPTFYSYLSNPSLIDHIWSNLDIRSHSFVFDSPVADHLPCISIFDTDVIDREFKISFRDFSAKNIKLCTDNIVNDIAQLRAYLDILNTIDDKVLYLTIWIETTVDKYFPYKSKTVCRRRLMAPWINSKIINLINKKHQLFRDFKNKLITYSSFSSYAKKLKILLKKLYLRYNRQSLNEYKFDMKKKWSFINEMMGRSSSDTPIEIKVSNDICTDTDIILKLFNEFFKDIPDKLKSKLSPSNFNYNNLIENNIFSFFLKPIRPAEVISVTSEMKNNSKNSKIPVKFIKIIIPHLGSILSDLFNKCISASYFPDMFKVATVIPLHKNNERTELSNYRPISLLTCIAKIFEKLLFDRLYEFFMRNHLICDNQFGFVRGRTTSHAAIHLTNFCSSAFEENKFALSVFIDFSKAFDCVERELLLDKLSRYGVRGPPLELLRSYMSDRKQRVRITDSNGKQCYSDLVDITGAVAQGSSLGPLFYLIFSNEIPKLFPGAHVTLYADDLVISMCGDDMTCLEGEMNSHLSTLLDWANLG